MKDRFILIFLALIALAFSCTKPQVPDEGYVESIPDTVRFVDSRFVYNGNLGDKVSDAWIVKLYTDMETDDSGDPVGPGTMVQLFLNVTYDDAQSADPDFLPGVYREMDNSLNYRAGTFVSGYMKYVDLPGQRIEVAEATFYAELEDGSADMEYEPIDEGALEIVDNGDGTFTIEGILVGKKYTKRYFTWTGEINPVADVPEQTPNSTLRTDLTGLTFAKAQIQDKGDMFYLMDESYRCMLLYLVDEEVDLSSYRPAGDGRVLRLELLVPWETGVEDGIPAGVYEMVTRNADTSIDKDSIVPGVAIPGLPDVFAEWKLGGTWLYELRDGTWTQNYARVAGGEVVVERGPDGSHTISYDLLDCQNTPRRIQGVTTLSVLETL